MVADVVLAVRGLGLRLPGVMEPGDLVRQITGRTPPSGVDRCFVAPGTGLVPVDRWVHGPAEVRLPEHLPTRGLRNWSHESLLALAAAAHAVPDRPAGPDPTAVLWASSTAGLAEYASICTDAALLDPGLVSPLTAPASAFNGPASTVSIRLGLTGPTETLIGGPTTGISVLVEAIRFLSVGAASRALVGASASISRWSLAGAADGFVPAEGAACLAVEPWRGETGVVTLRRARRVGLDPGRTVAQLRELVRSADRPDAGLVVSTLDVDAVDALSDRPVWHVERRLGDFGAAGGLLAVVCAVAYHATAGRAKTAAPTPTPTPTAGPADLLVLAVEPSGNASIVEVSSS